MSVNRYEATPIKNLDRYQTTRYPKISKTPRDKFIYTREQDRLDLLANEFYKDARYWWILAEANPELPKGTLIIPPGIQLRIPDVDLIALTNQLEEAEQDK